MLLAIARATLLEDVLPVVPAGQVYAVRMIANAMAIAARELGSGEDSEAERKKIAALYRRAELEAPVGTVEEMERALAADIRAGAFDAEDAALAPVLEWMVDGRIALANPRMRRAGKLAG